MLVPSKQAASNYHGLYIVGDFGVLTAHDSGKSHFLLAVADHQHAAVHVSLLAVQGLEHVAVLRAAHHDLVACDVVVIVGVHGLSVLFHHVVGDVNDVVDRTHPRGPQPVPHPLGGGGNLDVPHHPGSVPGAESGPGLHIQQVRQVARAAAFHHRIVEGEGLAIGDSRLSGQADNGQAVRAVRGDLKLHHMVV